MMADHGTLPDVELTTPRPPLGRRVDHVGVIVRDVQAASGWWTAEMGLQLVHVADVLDGTVRLAYLDAGDTTIQLVQPLAAGPVADWLAAHGEGLHHICLLVDSIPSTLDSLGDRGRRFIYRGGRGADVCFIEATPCSVLVELTEATEVDWVAGGATPVRVEEPDRQLG